MAASRLLVQETPHVHLLSVGARFLDLSKEEKLYAHFLSRAAWYGARIILHQTSPESNSIFDLIIRLYAHSQGDWRRLAQSNGILPEELDAFLDYAATFLSNVGNYYGSGDQKFLPNLNVKSLQKFTKGSKELERIFAEVSNAMYSSPPYSLGYPSEHAQSSYYLGTQRITYDEIAAVSRVLEEQKIFVENTRVRKIILDDSESLEVLQASVKKTQERLLSAEGARSNSVKLIRGDHSEELNNICSALSEAKKHASSEVQRLFLSQYIESFESGSLEAYRDSQRTWIKDKTPRIENIFGFVEPYRDPYGARAEFEGFVAITDPEETKSLKKLIDHSDKFIRHLPWVEGSIEGDNNAVPFEKSIFEPPALNSMHSLAYCSSIIFPGINLPNYNDIRQDCGFKNLIIANRMAIESGHPQVITFKDPLNLMIYQKCRSAAYYLWVVLHELFGHGTGKMMIQESETRYNFDIRDPPVNPLTGKPIDQWYKPGQTWTGQFGDLATTVDECRAELAGAYLMDNLDLLGLFGYTEKSKITSDDMIQNLYLQLVVDGIRGLANFNAADGKWGQAHSRAHFAMLKCLLTDGNGLMSVEGKVEDRNLVIDLDRSKILSHGKPALGRMLLKLHIFRCTADVDSCRTYYESMSRVDGRYLEWRSLVLASRQPKMVFVQPNIFIESNEIILREYEASREGLIKSWYERKV